jgi:predicted nucleotidyltransferase
MSDDLDARVRQAAEILTAAGAREIYLFGSAATKTMREDSDIDMAVAGLPPEVFFQAMGNAGEILQRSLDLVDLDEDNPFTRYLREEGELLLVSQA